LDRGGGACFDTPAVAGRRRRAGTLHPTGFFYDPIVLEHDTGSHPENGSRMTATLDLLEDADLVARMMPIPARTATRDELALVHDARYVDAVRRAAEQGGGWVDPDTLITPRTHAVAAAVVGGALNAVDAVVRGDVRTAYCLVRPPGHHATPVQAMGFCVFNHVAVAAAYLRERHGLERVAIVDIDVHHGNGTQDAFWRDASVLYVSTHEYPFYPGTGAAGEVGEGEGTGFTVNVPMPHGSGDDEHAAAFDEIVLPVLTRFRPQFVLVSAGFDAHFADPLAMQQLSVDGYGTLVERIVAAADVLCDGRVVAAQEGGYDLTALPWCVRRTVEVLTGEPVTPDPLGTLANGSPAGFDAVLANVKTLHGL
jgi:acetoin utilization deacetylase AcuC-like enzyme